MTSKSLPDMLMDDHQHALLKSRQYDRRPDLNLQEREALTQAMALCTGDNETRLPQQLNSALARLLQPCKDILAGLGASQKYCSVPIQTILQEMYARSTSYWSWSEDVWTTLLTTAFARFRHTYSPQTYRRVRFHLLVIAYVLGPHTDFFLPLLGDSSPLALASRVFGKQPVHSNVERVLQVLSGWGYGYEDASKQRCLATTIAEVMLVNRHQELEQITFARLICLRQRMKSYQRGTLERLSKVLAHWGIIEQALPPFSDTLRVLPEHTDTSGIAPEWVDWCLQWHRFSDLEASVKRQYFHILLRTGRWLAELHPEVTSPRQWSSLLAAEYVAAVTHMKVGEFCTAA